VGAIDVFEVAGAILLSAGGAGAVLFGLSSWLGKVWANKILEQDRKKYAEELEAVKEKHAANLSRLNGELEAMNRRLQAELDKTIHIYRVQFETEFKALLDIWRTAVAVRSAIVGLRPQMGFAEDNPDAAFLARFNDFLLKLHGFKAAVDDHSPFYTPEVFQKAEELLRIAIHEDVACRVREPRDGGWFRDGRASAEAFAVGCHALAESIRQRIAQLSVRD